MIAYPPPTGDLLMAPQRAAVEKIKTFLVQNEFDQQRINPHLSNLVSEMTAACASAEDQGRMVEELDRVVRWQRLFGYWLTYLFQLSMQQPKSIQFVTACGLFSDAQISTNEDLLLSSLENGYNALAQTLKMSGEENEQLRRVADNFLGRMHLVYQYYRQWYTPRPYSEINPLTEHLYSEKTLNDLRMVFPELNKPHPQFVADDYLRVIGQCSKAEDIYCRVVARRFLGSLYQGQRELRAAQEQFRLGLEEAKSVELETEIGHFHRLYGYALSQAGQLQEAAEQFESACAYESHPAFSYWQALSARELGDVRMKMAPREVDMTHPPREVGLALQAYQAGRSMFERNIGMGVVPVARAVNQQLFRSYIDNALHAVRVLQNAQDMLAELEAAGPRYATEIVAESKAASTLPTDVRVRFRQARAVFHQHLTAFNQNDTLDQDFARYLASVEEEREMRRLYQTTRKALTGPITHAQLSDEIAEKVLALRLPNVMFLLLHIGQEWTCGTLLDVGSGQMEIRFTPWGERHWQEQHEAYQRALQGVKTLPNPAIGMRRALDDMLSFCDSALSPLLEPFLQFLKGKHLKIFPRLFINEVPLHALTIGGKRLIEYCTISYAQTLGLFLQVHKRDITPSVRTLAMIYDEKGAPLYQGTLQLLNSTYKDDLNVLRNSSWQEIVSSVGEGRPTDIFFACHGKYNPDDPAASCLLYGDDEEVPFSKIFSDLDLTQCESVVLGACESGLGRTILTAEYLGLPIAFFAARVRYVIGSLWKVNQLTAAILLSNHYQLLRDAEHTVPSALNEAQRVTMQMSRNQVLAWVKDNLPQMAAGWEPIIRRLEDPPFVHPYYWAGFYVAGDI